MPKAIHEDKTEHGVKYFLVEWEDYPKRKDYTWQTGDDLGHNRDALIEAWENNKAKS